jgi:hypothetical protein
VWTTRSGRASCWPGHDGADAIRPGQGAHTTTDAKDKCGWSTRTARRGYAPRMSPGFPAPQLDVEVLADEVAEFLATVPVADGVGAKLSRLLNGFLEAQVLPQAERAADLGLDPTPFLAVVSDVLRLYAVALERPDAGVR